MHAMKKKHQKARLFAVGMCVAAMLFIIACNRIEIQPTAPTSDDVYENSSSPPVGTNVPNSTGENIGEIFSDNDGEVKPPIIPN